MVLRRALFAWSIWLAIVPLAWSAAQPRPAQAQGLLALPVIAAGGCLASLYCGAALVLLTAAGLTIVASDEVTLHGLYDELRATLPDWAQDGVVRAVQAGAQSYDVTGMSDYDVDVLQAVLDGLAGSGALARTPTGTWAGNGGETLKYPTWVGGNQYLLAYKRVTIPCDNYTASGAMCVGTSNATGVRVRWGEYNGEANGDVLFGVADASAGGSAQCKRTEAGFYGTGCASQSGGTSGAGTFNLTGVTGSAYDTSTNTQPNSGGDQTSQQFQLVITSSNHASWTTTGHAFQIPHAQWRLCSATTCSTYTDINPMTWTAVAGVGLAGATAAVYEGAVAIPRSATELTGKAPTDSVITPNGGSAVITAPTPAVGTGADVATQVGLLGQIAGTLGTIRDGFTTLPGAIATAVADGIGTAFADALDAAFTPTTTMEARVTALADVMSTKPPVSYLAKVQDAWEDASAYGDACPSVSVPYAPWSQTSFEMCLPSGVSDWTRAFSQFVAAGGLALWAWGFYRRLLE